MFYLRNDPITASEKEIGDRADDLLRQTEAKKWAAKDAMMVWVCAMGHVLGALAENKKELDELMRPYMAYLISTSAKAFFKRNPGAKTE